MLKNKKFIPQLNSKFIFLAILYLSIIILSPMIARENMIAILMVAGVLGIVALVFFRDKLYLGFPLIIISSLLIPFSISTGTQTSINTTIMISFMLMGAWIIDIVVFKQPAPKFGAKVEILAIAFATNTILAFGFGQFNWYPTKAASFFAQTGQSMLFVLSSIVFLVGGYKFKESKWIQWTVNIFIIVGGLYSLGFLIPPLRPYVNRIFQRAVIDSMFWSWLIILSFSQALLNKKLSQSTRLIFMVISASALFNVFITRQSWVSGWLPAVIGVFVVLLLYNPRLAAIAALLFASLFVIRFQLLQSYVLVGDNEYSMLSRWEAWKIIFEIIKKNPIFGVGPANYYYYTPFYNILGYHVQFNSHNNYLDIIAQTGLIGLTLFLWWFLEIGKMGFSLLKEKLTAFEHSFTIAVLGGLTASLVAAMLGDWIIPFIYNIGMEGFRSAVLGWLFFGGLLFLRRKYSSIEDQSHAQ
jgi:O-antigen ligase